MSVRKTKQVRIKTDTNVMKALKYAVSILESIPEPMLDQLQDEVLDETIDWGMFVNAMYGTYGKK